MVLGLDDPQQQLSPARRALPHQYGILFSSNTGNDLRDNGLLKLLYVVKFGFLPHLRILYLSDNKLQDASVLALIALLRQCKIAPSAELHIGCGQRKRE